MKKRNKLVLAAFAIILATTAIVLTSSASDKKTKEPTPTCCKKVDLKCSEPGKKTGPGELIMDNMSRQFISIFSTR